ncbi:hypothetical protein ACHAXS_011439 [Conticribra weissflogii]
MSLDFPLQKTGETTNHYDSNRLSKQTHNDSISSLSLPSLSSPSKTSEPPRLGPCRFNPNLPFEKTTIAIVHPPHCNDSLPTEERIQYLIDNLSTKEKISLLGHDSPAITKRIRSNNNNNNNNNSNGSETILHLPRYQWWNEGLHGMAWTNCCPPRIHSNVTVFPQVIGLGATFNRTLWGRVGDAIGKEAVAVVHHDRDKTKRTMHPGLTYWTPNVNIFRDPRWGRGQETPGEDPYLTSHYAAIMVLSLQYGMEALDVLGEEPNIDDATTIDSRTDESRTDFVYKPRIAATCKHYAAYSLETNRFNFSSYVPYDSRDWEDTYSVAFRACLHAVEFAKNYYRGRRAFVAGKTGESVREHDGSDFGARSAEPTKNHDKNNSTSLEYAGAMGIMCAYNAVNGIPSCANAHLLKTNLRRVNGFHGYIVSDCGAIANLYYTHHHAKSYEEAVGMSLRAGVDLDCGDTIQTYGMSALEQGYARIEDVDGALRNLFGVLMSLGYFDGEDVDSGNTMSTLVNDWNEHSELAFEASLQSMVLLKNGPHDVAKHPSVELHSTMPNPLPLSPAKHKKITLVGPLADDKEALLGNYHGAPSFIITPLQGLQDLGLHVHHIGDSSHVSNSTLCHAVISSHSDATILLMGLNQTMESEDLDRTSLLLPQTQREIIEIASTCSKMANPMAPVILVVISGGPIDLSLYKSGIIVNDSIVSSDVVFTEHDAVSNNSHDAIDAIMVTSYPGQAGGKALAHVLYGKYNPSGRLTTTMYTESYLTNVPLADMRMRPNGLRYPGRTYRFYDGGDVAYPFGWGLSYTSWNYVIEEQAKPPPIGNRSKDDNDYGNSTVESVISVQVWNTGEMDGSHTVLLFIMGPNAGRNGEPIKSLIGFEKVFVPAGQMRRVYFNVRNAASQSSFDNNADEFGLPLMLAVGPTMDFTIVINNSMEFADDRNGILSRI